MSKLVDCPDCAGTGNKVVGKSKPNGGPLRSVTFSFKDDCPTCAGTGKAFVKRNVLYAGRPDIRHD